jgi:hypothetical protein
MYTDKGLRRQQEHDYPYRRQDRIAFARSSISRAKIDLIRLAKHDPDCQYLVDQLYQVQNEFRLKYAKGKK